MTAPLSAMPAKRFSLRTMGSRFAVTIVCVILLCALCAYALYVDKTDVATSCITALTVIVPVYISGDTLRRSGADLLKAKAPPTNEQPTT